MTTVQRIKQWLGMPGNSKAKLAALLDYDSSATVQRWLTENRVPRHQEARINEVIQAKEKKNESTKAG